MRDSDDHLGGVSDMPEHEDEELCDECCQTSGRHEAWCSEYDANPDGE